MANERLTLQIDTVTTGEASVNKLADSMNRVVSIADRTGKSIGAAADDAEPKWKKLGLAVKDLAEGRSGYAGIEGGYFLTSLTGASAVAGGLTTAVLALGAASLSATKGLAELGLQTQAISLKTGLSTKEVGQFSFAAKAAGSDVGAFESAMRKLSQGLTEGGEEGKKASDALRTLGVSSRNLDGTLRPMGEIFEGVGAGMAKIGSAAERNTLAVQLFGKSGIELIPTLVSLNANLARSKELGVGLSDAELAKFERYHSQLTEIGAAWDVLSRKMKEGIAGTLTLNIVKGTIDLLSGKDKSSIGTGATGAALLAIPGLAIGGPWGAIAGAAIGAGLGIGAGKGLNYLTGQTDSLNLKTPSIPGAPTSDDIGDARAKRFQQRNTPEGINARITELEQKNSNLSANIYPGGDTTKSSIAEYEANQRTINGLKESLKSLNEQEAKYQKSLDEERKLREAGTPFYILGSGANRTLISSQDIADNLRKAGGRTAPSLYNTDFGSGNLLEPPSEAEVRRLGAALRSRQNLNVGAPDVGSLLPPGTIPGLSYNNAPNELGKTIGSEIEQALDKFKSDSLKENSARISELHDVADRQSRLVGINAGPGSELSTASQQYSIRQNELATERSIINASAQLYDMKADEYRLTKESQDSTLEYLTSVSSLQQKQKEEFSSTVVQGFNAATQRYGAHVATRDFATGIARNFADTVVGNAARLAFQSAPFQAFKSGISGAGGNSTLGKLLAGTPFGQKSIDPQKMSLDANTLRTDANTDATNNLTSMLANLRAGATSPSGGGGGMPSGSGIAAAIASGNVGADGLPLMNYGGVGTGTGQASLFNSSGIGPDGLPLMNYSGVGTGTGQSSMLGMGASKSSDSGADPGYLGGLANAPQLMNSGGTGSPLSSDLPIMNYSGLGSATGQSALLASAMKAANGFGAGLASFFSGTALSTLFNKSGTASTSSQIGAGVSLVGALAGGAEGIYSGIKQGGVGGDLKAAGSGVGLATGMISNIAKLVGATSPLLSAIPIVGTAIAAVLPLIGGLFNGPQQRATAISNELQANTYMAPTALNVTQSSNGNFADFNAKGQLRTSNFSAVPTVAEPYIWQQTHGFLGGPPTYYDVPGGQTGQFNASKTAAPAPTVIIQAMDSQSFSDFTQRNHAAIGNAVATHLQNNSGRLSSEIQRTANG